MKTLRIETVAQLLELSDLDKTREWCHSNGITLYEKGVIEFVLLDEVLKALGAKAIIYQKREKL